MHVDEAQNRLIDIFNENLIFCWWQREILNLLSVNCYEILNTHVEADGGEKKDELQVNQIPGMGTNSDSELGSIERHYKSGISKNFPHVNAGIYHVHLTPFVKKL